MTTYAIFENSSGTITRVFRGPKSVADLQCSKGEKITPCDEDTLDTTHWVDQGRKVRKKSLLDTKHTCEGSIVTFHAIPAGTRIDVDGHSLTTDSDPTVIEFDVPGTYRIEFRPPPQYLDAEMEVTVG